MKENVIEMPDLKTKKWAKFVDSTELSPSSLQLLRMLSYLILIGLSLAMLICSVFIIDFSWINALFIIGLGIMLKIISIRYFPRTRFLDHIGWLISCFFAGYSNIVLQMQLQYPVLDIPIILMSVSVLRLIMGAFGLVSILVVFGVISHIIITLAPEYWKMKKQQKRGGKNL